MGSMGPLLTSALPPLCATCRAAIAAHRRGYILNSPLSPLLPYRMAKATAQGFTVVHNTEVIASGTLRSLLPPCTLAPVPAVWFGADDAPADDAAADHVSHIARCRERLVANSRCPDLEWLGSMPSSS